MAPSRLHRAKLTCREEGPGPGTQDWVLKEEEGLTTGVVPPEGAVPLVGEAVTRVTDLPGRTITQVDHLIIAEEDTAVGPVEEATTPGEVSSREEDHLATLHPGNSPTTSVTTSGHVVVTLDSHPHQQLTFPLPNPLPLQKSPQSQLHGNRTQEALEAGV